MPDIQEFPNEWEEMASLPPDAFETLTCKEVMDLADSWCLDKPGIILRTEDKKTGRVKEVFVFPKSKLKGKVEKAILSGMEVTFYDQERMSSTHSLT